MKKLMRYTIKSGRLVEKRDVLMEVSLDPTTGKARRRGRRTGKATAAQVERNQREAVLRLNRLICCNYRGGDLFVSLKYANGRLPATREEAERLARNFVRRLSRAYRALTGKKLPWVLVTADRSSKTGAPVRLHHHLVLPAMPRELLAANWPADQFSARWLDDKGDYIGIAEYMVRNAGYVRGKRTWSTSQGMDKPEFSAPEPVRQAGDFRVPKEAKGVFKRAVQDEDSGFYAAYVRYVMPEDHGNERADFLDTARRAGAGATRAGSSKGAAGGGGVAPPPGKRRRA